MEFSKNDPEEALPEFFAHWFDEKLKNDAFRYVRKIKENLDKIDEIISSKLVKWTFDRLNSVDRNILRLGTYELLYEDDIPIEVTLDEMIKLAKRYGTENSGKFVNGVLDRIAKEYAPKHKRNL